MSILMRCPACDKELKAADEKRGGKIRCPRCQEVFRISLEDTSDHERAEPGKAAALPWILAGTGAMVGVVGIIVALILATREPPAHIATARPENAKQLEEKPAPSAPAPASDNRRFWRTSRTRCDARPGIQAWRW
jgi:phage FluMu protein Com